MIRYFSLTALLVLSQNINGQLDPANTACFYQAPVLSNMEIFCNGVKDRLILGDFDGNGRSDLLCQKGYRSSSEVFFNLQTHLSQDLDFCDVETSKLKTGDFNGDSRDDLLCIPRNSNVTVLLADQNGRFNSSNAGTSTKICRYSSEFYVQDFNGDGMDDILCRSDKGNITLSYAKDNGEFHKEHTEDFDFCNGSGQKLYTGDFNGDNRADLLCHSATGVISIVLFSAKGIIKKIEWSKDIGWCTMENSFILVSDVNGDEYDDLICKDTNLYGLTYVSLNQPYQYFKNGNKYKFHFCLNGGKKNFFVGDFNGDEKIDLLCQTGIGTRQISVSHCA